MTSTALTLHNMTPETQGSTHYFYCNTRPYLVDDIAFSASLKATLEYAFATEDKVMLERQQQRIGNTDFASLKPVLLSVDAASTRARRKLAELLAEEARAALPEST